MRGQGRDSRLYDASLEGGQSREAWINDGKKPALAGSTIFATLSIRRPTRRAARPRNLGLMMREGLLKENIDGEALDWAHRRLMARSEQRRILMMISDGRRSTIPRCRSIRNYLERICANYP